ncbi:conserved exported hypothetical protein [uncultured Paludibacter sp.]|nr:conserved exported hypothetical protein [uncultured Paludibacter sp.]
MRKILLFFLCLAQFGIAQQVNVLSLEKIKVTENGGYFYPKFSPANDYILLSQINYKGLVKYSFTDQNLKVINEDPGAGYDVQISNDGETILYKKIELINKLRHNSLITQDLSSNEKTTLVLPTRENVAGKLINSSPVYVKGKKMIKNSSVAKNISPTVITIEDKKMVLYKNGIRKELTPNGNDKSYIWPSISPDGIHIVYTVAGKGTFVANIDGTNIKSFGKLSAPKWAGNKYIVGMDDIDDGQKLISSTIKIVSIDGKIKEKLNTPEGVNAMYPSASNDGSKIAFNTEKGEVYIMNVELK